MTYKEFVETLKYNNFRRKRVKLDIFALMDNSKFTVLKDFISPQDLNFLMEVKNLITIALKNLHGTMEQNFKRFIEQNHTAPTNKAIVEKLFEFSGVQIGEDSIAKVSKILNNAINGYLREWQYR